jgi:dextranase
MIEPANLLAFFATRPFFTPQAPVTVSIEVSSTAIGRTGVELRLVDLDGTVAGKRIDVERRKHIVDIPVTARTGDSYGLHAALVDTESGRTLDTGYTAVDFHESWFDAPRYAFLSEFGPGEDYEERANELLRRHVTAVQFYDWMYRHYQLLPPSADYADILGRSISLDSVESAIAASHSRGMAAIAYGSVYGAEAEYALDHPEELLYDENGKPISLAEIFYLQDVRPGPWRDRILGEYQKVVRRLEFDGIHADQYGKETGGTIVYDHAGSRVELGPALAGMIGAAQATVMDAGGDGIIFNFVSNWPIQDSACEPQLATYIEVWPPYTTLGHLAELIRGAKCLAPERQVILAAYMSCATEDPDAAESATLLTSAAIHAAGGFHLLLGEGTGILVHAYYPKFVRPGPYFQERLREHWDFVVRYGRYLWDRSLAYSRVGGSEASGVWSIHRIGSELETLSLLNVDPISPWDKLKTVSPKRDVPVSMPLPDSVEAVYVADPEHPDPVALPYTEVDGLLQFTVPSVNLWSLVIVRK